MILGIDPGLANTGWAVVKRREDGEGELVASGCVETKVDSASAVRLNQIYEAIANLVKKYKVEIIALESLFFARNAKSAIKVSEAIGVIKVCGDRCGVEVVDYTPLQVKISLVGYGQASKDQVEIMVRNFLFCKAESGEGKGKVEQMFTQHATDAAAVALTHLFTNQDLVR